MVNTPDSQPTFGGFNTMSMIAIGVSAAVTVGTGINSASQQKKAAKQQASLANGLQFDARAMEKIIAEIGGYHAVDVQGVAGQTASNNAGRGVKLARRSASRINDQAVADTIKAMNKLYGGQDRYEGQRESIFENLEENLAGRVSKSTRAQVGRGLLAQGVSQLGADATAQAYTGYLGLTAEGLQEQGANRFQSLYQTWRQSVPLISASQILDRFTISPDNAVQAEIANAQADFNSRLALGGLKLQIPQMEYQHQMNRAGMLGDAAAMRANAASTAASSIASAAGTWAGNYSANQGYTPPSQPARQPVVTAAPNYSQYRKVSERPTF